MLIVVQIWADVLLLECKVRQLCNTFDCSVYPNVKKCKWLMPVQLGEITNRLVLLSG